MITFYLAGTDGNKLQLDLVNQEMLPQRQTSRARTLSSRCRKDHDGAGKMCALFDEYNTHKHELRFGAFRQGRDG